ncbi:MAG: sulfite exporter TauE/SafE family protein [Candidatus Kapaibacterium sp.]|nr:MAG: sulfite exporter TauE/SafE family protein [Candidatus Kapabacteria bacterium]
MLDLPFFKLAILCTSSFCAGLIDSMVGGGGLILIPTLLLLFPQMPIPSVIGTNKFAAVQGMGMATLQYIRTVHIPWHSMIPAALAGFCSALVGAKALTVLDSSILRPVIVVLLIAIALYTAFRKDFGSIHAPHRTASQQRAISVALGMVLGLYDGFFGPGTGSFLIFGFIGFLGFGFLDASSSAKLVNFAMGCAALGYFLWTGNVRFEIGIPLAAFNIAGAFVGARLAVQKGSRFVRGLFLVVVGGVIAKLAWDMLR